MAKKQPTGRGSMTTGKAKIIKAPKAKTQGTVSTRGKGQGKKGYNTKGAI